MTLLLFLFYLEKKINNEGKVMLCTLWLRCYCTVKILVTVTFLRVVVWVNFFCITQQKLHMHDRIAIIKNKVLKDLTISLVTFFEFFRSEL